MVKHCLFSTAEDDVNQIEVDETIGKPHLSEANHPTG